MPIFMLEERGKLVYKHSNYYEIPIYNQAVHLRGSVDLQFLRAIR